jgi:hypothetical protein
VRPLSWPIDGVETALSSAVQSVTAPLRLRLEQTCPTSIPVAVYQAIVDGVCLTLPQRDGLLAVTTPTLCPGCGQMRAFFIVRQHIPSATWSCTCWACMKEGDARLFHLERRARAALCRHSGHDPVRRLPHGRDDGAATTDQGLTEALHLVLAGCDQARGPVGALPAVSAMLQAVLFGLVFWSALLVVAVIR